MTVKVQRRVMAMQVKMFAEILLKLKRQVQRKADTHIPGERTTIGLLFDLETKKQQQQHQQQTNRNHHHHHERSTIYIVMLIYYSL